MVLSFNTRLTLWTLLGSLLLSPLLNAANTTDNNVFGSRERVTPALLGIFYDLKQTQQRTPVVNYAKTYASSIDSFLANGFKEHDLSGFFRAGLPLYNTQISIPKIDANAAPKAFGVEQIVKPSYWMVHYKGQITAPAAGTYRFVGHGDNVLVVAINGKIVLIANLKGTSFPNSGWKPPADQGPPMIAASTNPVVYGGWLDFNPDEPVDIDILIGERPGGNFQAVLLYMKKGEVYPSDSKNRPRLPLFQLAEKKMDSTHYLTDLPAWRCLE